jgi:16S rRNA (adenine1518-N6/adenine1519-N6)-dimethyltransferase
VVVEIGAGRGSLTAELLSRAGRVIAVELDGALAERLRATFAGDERLTVIARDVLDTSVADLAGAANYLAVGNVPYYITTPIIFHLLRPPRPRAIVLLVQREVAERMAAPPGTAAYGALSVNVQALATHHTLFTVPPGAFMPPPTVESAVVRLEPRPDPAISDADQHAYARFVIAAFGLRRKQMRRVLRTIAPHADADAVLARAAIDPQVRPEVLTAEQFAEVFELLRR